MSVQDIEGLDSGISDYVHKLMKHGVETFESCEGGEGHCFPEPTVRFRWLCRRCGAAQEN